MSKIQEEIEYLRVQAEKVDENGLSQLFGLQAAANSMGFIDLKRRLMEGGFEQSEAHRVAQSILTRCDELRIALIQYRSAFEVLRNKLDDVAEKLKR